MAISTCSVDDNLNVQGLTANITNDTNFTSGTGCWTYYTDYYYPYVIQPSYPVYLQERAQDKGKQAFEIIKILKDKKLVQITKVSQFIDLMDELIKIL